MKRKLNLSKRIWLSMSILVIGYFLTMVVGFQLGAKIETRMMSVSDTLFPAATLGQNALTAFKDQTRLYKDGVLFGDTEIISKASEKSKLVLEALNGIVNINGIDKAAAEELSGQSNFMIKFVEDLVDLAGLHGYKVRNTSHRKHQAPKGPEQTSNMQVQKSSAKTDA